MKKELWNKAKISLDEIYNNNIPLEIINRYTSEQAELKENEAIVYFDLISKLKSLALKNSGHVRLRGTLGASFVAFLMGATDTNPLSPNYYCPKCHKVEFARDVKCGWDLPPLKCTCGTNFIRDGLNLPFETIRGAPTNGRYDLSISRNIYDAIKKEIQDYFNGYKIVFLKGENIDAIVVITDNSKAYSNLQELSYEKTYGKLLNYPKFVLIKDDGLDSLCILEKETGVKVDDIEFNSTNLLSIIKTNDFDDVPELCSPFLKNIIAMGLFERSTLICCIHYNIFLLQYIILHRLLVKNYEGVHLYTFCTDDYARHNLCSLFSSADRIYFNNFVSITDIKICIL